MFDILLVCISSVLLAVSFVFNKFYAQKFGTGAIVNLSYLSITGLFISLFFFIINGFKIEITPISILLASLSSAFVFLYTIIGFKMLKNGLVASYSLFLMSGGMTVPFIWGVLRNILLNDKTEKVTALSIIGVILIIFGVIMSNYQKENGKKSLFILGIVVFFLNGFNSVCGKIHQSTTSFKTVSTSQFVVLQYFVGMLICSVMIIILMATKKCNVDDIKPIFNIKSILLLLFVSIVTGTAAYCLFKGAINLSATVIYPISTGGTIILSALGGKIVFKEKFKKRNIIGIVACFIGTCIFCIL